MKKHLIIALAQLGVCAAILLLPPLTVWMSTGDSESATIMAYAVRSQFMIPMLLFFINYYVLVPLIIERWKSVWTFTLVNILITLGLNWKLLTLNIAQWGIGSKVGEMAIYSGLFLYAVFCVAAIIIAAAMRNFIRTAELRRQVREQRHRMTEAELAWLKNQLNPHFLFNTLNNISSLTSIDAERAQDALGQLSDLLRYALYETSKPTVPLDGEIDFMHNYIDLMSLRCADNVRLDIDLPTHPTSRSIAPLLFLSPIENAFKHGISTSQPSFIHIALEEASDGTVRFLCENSNHPKPSKRSGSGIGTDNLKRRLKLLYPNRHTFEQQLDGDTFITHITLKP